MNSIDISPEACAARKARIEAAAKAAVVRQRKLSDAREIVRTQKLVTDYELFAALSNIQASIVGMNDWSERLQELLTEMDDAIFPVAEAPTYADVPVVLTLQADVPRTNRPQFEER